jgi:hypothetical protein
VQLDRQKSLSMIGGVESGRHDVYVPWRPSASAENDMAIRATEHLEKGTQQLGHFV